MKRETRHRIEDRLAGLIAALVGWLPRSVMLALAHGLGRVWAACDGRHLAIAADNLRQAFPDWDEARIARTARGVYAHFGAIMVDLLWLGRRSRDEILSIVEWEGCEHYEAAKASGSGMLFVLGHLGNWEVLGVAHGYVHEPAGVIARPLDNPALDERLTSFRRRGGNIVISKWQALQQTLRLIRVGKGVAVLIDQNVQEKDGIFVRFFGRPAATTTVAAAVALKTGCILVPVRTRLLPNGHYRFSYEAPPAWTPTGERVTDIVGLTQALTSRIEAWVREAPEQWLWLHRRWKTQPAPAEVDAVGRG
jgi:Kdo2-lipid IVA lauroyltransferase/acyltransferase